MARGISGTGCFLILFGHFFLAAHALAETSFDWEKGFRAELGELDLRIGALLHADAVRFDEDITDLEATEDFRRARLISRLNYAGFRFKADYDFGVSDGWKSLLAEYRGVERLRVIAGNHTAPFSMEDNSSSSNLGFFERSAASALAPGLLNGVSVRRWGDSWTLSGGIFADEFNDKARRTAPGRSLIGRATWTPLREEDSIVHLGIAHERRKIDSGEAVRLRARPSTRIIDDRLVDTRSLDDADRLTTEGYELAWAHRNRLLQAEWYRSRVSASSADPRFDGYYLTVSTTVGAKDYRYSRSRGVFRRVRPKASWGALELSLRYAELDLTDDGVEGGRQIERGIGVTWIHSRQLRVMGNIARIEARPNRDGEDEEVDLFGLRLVMRL